MEWHDLLDNLAEIDGFGGPPGGFRHWRLAHGEQHGIREAKIFHASWAGRLKRVSRFSSVRSALGDDME
jgi:hypothetical protein